MDTDAILKEFGDASIEDDGERRRDAMGKWSAARNAEQKEIERKAALLRGGVQEVACSWCETVGIPAYRDGDIVACTKCMGKALFGALGDPKHVKTLPPAPAKQDMVKSNSGTKEESLWDEADEDEANEPAVTKAVS